MIGTACDWLLKRPGRYLHRNFMERPGIRNNVLAAKVYNRLRYGRRQRAYEAAFRRRGPELLAENGLARAPEELSVMRDGFAIDTSGSLPHLEELLRDTDRVIAERAGQDQRGTVFAQQPFFFSLFRRGDFAMYPSFLDFVMSSELLATVAGYLQCVPVLSKTLPPGLRLMESTSQFDDERDGPPRASQLYHLDLHDSPMVYVIVLLQDAGPQCGPFTFLPASVSAEAARKLRYQGRGEPYRVTDARMYEVVDEQAKVVFTYPKGTVLFIDSSRCFHFGSRDSVVPRYQMMYAFTTNCRTDFTQTFMRPRTYPITPEDSTLRQMVLAPS